MLNNPIRHKSNTYVLTISIFMIPCSILGILNLIVFLASFFTKSQFKLQWVLYKLFKQSIVKHFFHFTYVNEFQVLQVFCTDIINISLIGCRQNDLLYTGTFSSQYLFF